MSSSRNSSASSIRSISSIKPKIPHQLPKLCKSKKEDEKKISFATDISEQDIKDDKALQRYNLMMKQLNEISAKNNQNKENKRVPSGKLTPLSPSTNKGKKLNLQASSINAKCAEITLPKKNRLSPLRHDESDSEDSGSDADFRKSLKAPNELLQEFLVYIMNKKWEDAHKLCSFILMYEPNNKTAKEFLPLIESKLSESSDEDDTESDDTSDEDENDDEQSNSETESDEEDTDSDRNIDSGNDHLIENYLA